MSFRNTSRRILATTATQRATALSSQFRQPFIRTMTSVPSTMKGVVINKTGGTEVLEYKTDLPVPQPKEGQILVKNDFIGINFIDTYFRSGLYPAPGYPYTLGREAEGTVVATGTGELYGLKEGDKTVWMAEGGYAEYTAVPAAKAVKVPSDMDPKIGAAALLQGLTALTLVREAHAVKKGDWVLVHAAAGGTGLWLTQLLKSIGANTIGTASTPEKVELAKKAGATYVINYSKEDVKSKIDELTNKQGVIAVFDGVGKDTFDLSLDVLARKGSLISFGNASGAVPPVTIARLSAKNARLMRPTLFGYVATREEFEHYVKELFDFVLKDKLDVRIHEVYPLSEVARAHEDLQGRKTTGKLLLDPSK
ncbi:Putative quinone oxidoreductase/zeta-crystallin, GroES-like superfamily, alcohol dehydrogenase [Septoria linicola]|uniref:Probable quinone oxidoreductase n=1 Tax=Septoria linicola TaxID=215465 RepID=A0A9Q9B4V4_9PEZI|nr:Putative quinone oxidoreductase/zeta-crystallin, GroES-like superfamily, alcohol dehydrogenase [Septoria linicola]